ncbi:hypothetical protein PAMP_024151 [Pampus punctatissimus]
MRGRGARMHHKTACCSCAGDEGVGGGVKGHRELDLLGQQVVGEGGDAVYMPSVLYGSDH